MIVGVLGDTHGRTAPLRAAMKLLRDAGTQFYIHTGDVGSFEVLDQFAGLQAAFVFGNNDFDRQEMQRYAQLIGIACHGNLADLELSGKRIAVIHGDDIRLKQQILTAQQHNYLFQGHTHLRSDQRVGRTRIINPGALHRATQKSVATLDLESDTLKFHFISAPPS